MELEQVVERFGGGKRAGAGYKVRCPAHEDKEASLSISLGRNGRILLKCHAGCTWDDIIRVSPIDARELAPEDGPGRGRGTGNPWTDSKIVEVYDYRDPSGQLLFQTVRFDPKDFRQRRPDPSNKGKWIRNLDGVELVLYRLPELLRALAAGSGVFIAEGEKDVNNLHRLGVAATTSPMGAGKWRDGYSEVLRGVHVAIIADKDKAGRAHAAQVAASLRGKAASVRVLELPGAGKDASDWIAAGGTQDELRTLANQAPEWLPAASAPEAPAEAAKPAPAAVSDWPAPVPLGPGRLPEFPVQALPPVLRQFVAEEAWAIQVPVAAIAMLTIAAAAAVVARKIRVQVAPGWQEPLNLFVAVVLPPGERKSQAVRDCVAPIEAWERTAAREKAVEIEEARVRKDILEQQAKKARMRAAGAKDDESRADLQKRAIDLARAAADFRIPAPPRVLADDITPEKLAGLLNDHGGRMALFSPEGGIFNIMAGHYSKGSPNFEVFLKGHAGDTLRVDRIGRPPEFVVDPALTLGLAIQPDVVRSLSSKPGFRGRGLLGRFLYAMPESLLGQREIEPEPLSVGTRQIYHDTISGLLNLPEGQRDAWGGLVPTIIQLDPQALRRFREYQRELEPKLAPLGELGSMTDWAGKLAGAVARIAAVLHLAEMVCLPEKRVQWDTPVTWAAVDRAIEISGFLVAHANAAYFGMHATPDTDKAERVLRWITGTARERFTPRELLNGIRSAAIRSVAELEPALSLLTDSGHLRRIEERPARSRVRIAYLVHPEVLNVQKIA